MQLTKNEEDYLEIIHLLNKEKKIAKVKEISSKLNVSLPSVTGMIKKLANKDLVNYCKYSPITLTSKGNLIAKTVYAKHKVLTTFFIQLGVSSTTASHDACLAEHILSKETINKIKEFISKNKEI